MNFKELNEKLGGKVCADFLDEDRLDLFLDAQKRFKKRLAAAQKILKEWKGE